MEKLNRKIKSYILYEIEMYHENKRQLAEYKQDIIEASPLPADGQPRGSGLSNPVESKAIKIDSSAYIRKTEQTIKAIERAFSRVSSNHYRVFELMYWRKTHTAIGAAMELHAHKATIYRWINEVVMIVAKELGYI